MCYLAQAKIIVISIDPDKENSPRSILVLSGRYHIISNASLVNNCIIFLFLNQNIYCGYSKEQSQGNSSFEHPKHMLKLMDKKMFTFLR